MSAIRPIQRLPDFNVLSGHELAIVPGGDALLHLHPS